MAKARRPDPKRQALRAQGVLHRHAESVTDALFHQIASLWCDACAFIPEFNCTPISVAYSR